MNYNSEIPLLTKQIRALYDSLDKEFGLNSSHIPINFGNDMDVLGSYTLESSTKEEQFYFSLPFVSHSAKRPLSKEDRLDLYKHEYAHFMQFNMDIPEKYMWQPGIHGSAWKYCCSLVGAAPTPYYKVGEGLKKHDYDKALTNKINDKTIPIRDNYRREQEYQAKKNSAVRYLVGDTVKHPKFGEGIVEEIEPLSGSVRLTIRFGDELKKIDQKWLLRSQCKKQSDR